MANSIYTLYGAHLDGESMCPCYECKWGRWGVLYAKLTGKLIWEDKP